MSAPSAPPPRPFLGIRSPNFSVSSQDWVGATDDDPWDSASDNERSPKGIPINRHTSGLRSPKRKNSSSSSNLALSYTHVTAPSPGSYPGKVPDMPRVGGSNLNSGASTNAACTSLGAGSKGEGANKDGTSWMIVSSPRQPGSGKDDEAMEYAFDTTIDELDEPPSSAKRLQEGKEAIKYDVDDLVNGTDSFRSLVVSVLLS
jgi:hypothetical protein